MIDTPQPKVPSFLRARAAKAKLQAQQLRDAAPAPHPVQTAPQQDNDGKIGPAPHAAVNRHAKISHKPLTSGAGKKNSGRKIEKRGGDEGSRDRISHRIFDGSPGAPPLVDAVAVAEAVLARSADREMAELMRPVLPAVISAVLTGARIVGRQGDGDRLTLYRLLGVRGLDRGAQRGPDGGGGHTDRLATALSRLERRLSGHAPVTITGNATEEVPPDAVVIDDGHMIANRLPVPTDGPCPHKVGPVDEGQGEAEARRAHRAEGERTGG